MSIFSTDETESGEFISWSTEQVNKELNKIRKSIQSTLERDLMQFRGRIASELREILSSLNKKFAQKSQEIENLKKENENSKSENETTEKPINDLYLTLSEIDSLFRFEGMRTLPPNERLQLITLGLADEEGFITQKGRDIYDRLSRGIFHITDSEIKVCDL